MTNVLLKFDRANLSRDLQMFAVCLGAVLGLGFLFIVPVLAGTLGVEITAWSVRILAFAVFLSAIQGQLRACITKRKGFQELAVVDTIAVVGAISTCTYLLFAGYKEEVLVLKLLLESSLLLMSYTFFLGQKFTPRLAFHRYLTRAELKYGFGVLFSRFQSGAVGFVDRYFVGQLLAGPSFGAYFYFKSVLLLPDQLLRTALTNPALAHGAKLEKEESFNYFLKIYMVILFGIILPTSTLIGYGDLLLMPWVSAEWYDYMFIINAVAMFAISMNIKGWLGVANINGRAVVSWNLYLTGELIGLAGCLSYLSLIGASLTAIVSAVSVFFLVYWLSVQVMITHYSNLTISAWLMYYTITVVILSVLISWLSRDLIGSFIRTASWAETVAVVSTLLLLLYCLCTLLYGLVPKKERITFFDMRTLL